MSYNPEIHHRHSIRLNSFDYSLNGMYYITICTQDRTNLLGKIIVGADLVSAQINLSDAGEMIEAVLKEMACLFSNIEIDHYTVMPNHIHFILALNGTKTSGRADTRSAPTETKTTIGKFVQAFKAKTTVEYVKGVKNGLYSPFSKRIWQRNYYEHIIRDDDDYKIKWDYIERNPAKWAEDEYNTL